MAKPTKFAPDGLEHIEKSDMIQLSREFLESLARATGIMDWTEMDGEKLKQGKLILGMTNAVTKAMHTKMQFFVMVGIADKVKAVKARSKKF